MFNLNFIY